MKKSNISKIIKMFLSARFPSETEEKVQKDKNQQAKAKASLDFWNELDVEADSNTYASLERVNLRTGYNKEHLTNIASYQKFARIAAVIIPLFLFAGGMFYYLSPQNEMIEVSVAYGEQKHLILPDSSEVWLNAGSTILYPETFAKDKRLVMLDGEAYFSVKKDTASPFIVEASQLSVKVLGTRFNVKAYPNDEKITTTLTSGKVEVSVQSQPPHILKPNEQLTYDKKSSDIHISMIDTNDTNCWMVGKLVFTNASAGEIFRTLERHYNTTIDNTATIPTSKRYTVKFLKDESLDEILNILKDIIGFDYQQYEKKIVTAYE